MDDKHKNLKPHPLAERFPKRVGGDRESLKAAIVKRNGLIDPIVLKRRKDFDGNTRYELCIETGIEPTFTDFNASYGDPIEWLISKHSYALLAAAEFARGLRRGWIGARGNYRLRRDGFAE